MKKPPALRRNCGWPDKVLFTPAEHREYHRLMKMIRADDIETDSAVIVFSSDGILQFARADLIPWFYCTTERVEDLLRWWVTDGFGDDSDSSSCGE